MMIAPPKTFPNRRKAKDTPLAISPTTLRGNSTTKGSAYPFTYFFSPFARIALKCTTASTTTIHPIGTFRSRVGSSIVGITPIKLEIHRNTNKLPISGRYRRFPGPSVSRINPSKKSAINSNTLCHRPGRCFKRLRMSAAETIRSPITSQLVTAVRLLTTTVCSITSKRH